MRGLSADSMDECAAPEELCATTHDHTTRKRHCAKHSTPAETQQTTPYLLCGGISREARKQNSPKHPFSLALELRVLCSQQRWWKTSPTPFPFGLPVSLASARGPVSGGVYAVCVPQRRRKVVVRAGGFDLAHRLDRSGEHGTTPEPRMAPRRSGAASMPAARSGLRVAV